MRKACLHPTATLVLLIFIYIVNQACDEVAFHSSGAPEWFSSLQAVSLLLPGVKLKDRRPALTVNTSVVFSLTVKVSVRPASAARRTTLPVLTVFAASFSVSSRTWTT